MADLFAFQKWLEEVTPGNTEKINAQERDINHKTFD